jgi:signal transduction histidine kinase
MGDDLVAAEAEELARARRHLEALLRSSEPLLLLSDAESVARVAAEQGATLIPGIECAVAVRDVPDSGVLRLAGGSGATFADLVGMTMELRGSLAERALAGAAPVETCFAREESPVAAQLEDAPQTARLVPLVVRAQADQALSLGVIGYYRPGHDGFLPEERRLLDEYATRVAVALHRAALLDHATRTARRLRTGIDVAIDLGSSLDPRLVIRRLIERAATAVDAHRTSFGRVAGDVVVIEDSYASPGSQPVQQGTVWRVEDIPILHAAVHEGRAVQVGVSEPRDAATAALMAAMQHTLVLPLLSEGTTVAVLSVSRLRDEEFDEEALAVLQQVGTVAVLALRNARLFEARRDFMNMAAHELRTPLTVLNGYLSMLRDGTFGPPSEAWLSPLAVLEGKVGELTRLIDDLLIGARLEREATTSRPQVHDLAALAEAAVERARPRTSMLHGQIRFSTTAEAAPVFVDADDVGRILDNLVNNALTYSNDAPQVSVAVEVAGSRARVLVGDHGRGIPEELHERVFEQFFRVEDRRSTFTLGTGLGLYIGRGLADAHGGTLRIDRSHPGDGSTFVLELPLHGAASP